MIPLDLAFEPEFSQKALYQVFDNIVDALFIVDMILMFFTSYLNKQGLEIFSSKKIALNYIKSFRFLADSGAVLGTGVVTQFYPVLKIFGIFKMTRVMRLGSFISRLNIPLDIKSLLKLVKMTFYLVLWIHSSACIWHIVCK